MIWTHLKGMISTCTPHNRNLEMPYYGRALGGCAYTVEGEDPDVDSLFAIFPDGHAEFRSRENAVPDLDYKYPDCIGGVQLDMDCVTWADAGASWDCCTGTCDCTGGELEVLGVGPRQILDNDEGEILDENGVPIEGIIVSECGKVTIAPFDCPTTCNPDTVPAAWRVEIAGFTGPPVLNCTDLNGNFFIDIEGVTQECTWIFWFDSELNPEAGWVAVYLGSNTQSKITVRANAPGIGDNIVTFETDLGNLVNCYDIEALDIPLTVAAGCEGIDISCTLWAM